MVPEKFYYPIFKFLLCVTILVMVPAKPLNDAQISRSFLLQGEILKKIKYNKPALCVEKQVKQVFH